MPRRPRRVAEAGGSPFVEIDPGEILIGLGEPILVGDGIAQARRRHVGGIGQDDHALEARQPVGEPFEQRHEGEIDHHQPILRMIDDPGDLLHEQAWIDRVIDRADAGDPVPGLDMTPAVPGDRGDAVAGRDARRGEAFGATQRPAAHGRVGRALDRPLDRTGHDLARAVLDRGMVEDAVDQQRPILHQSKHRLRSSFGTVPHYSFSSADHTGPDEEKGPPNDLCASLGQTARRRAARFRRSLTAVADAEDVKTASPPLSS